MVCGGVPGVSGGVPGVCGGVPGVSGSVSTRVWVCVEYLWCVEVYLG